jgi:DNA polymerase III epsilon subunit-like protein
MTRIAFIDLETTGLEHDKVQIVELAIVCETGRCLLSTRYGLNPTINLQTDSEIDAALSYNKLTREELGLYGKMTSDSLFDIYNLLACRDFVVAHNSGFDYGVLKETSLRLIGKDIFKDLIWKCSMKEFAKEKGIKSGRVKLPNLQLNPIAHSALSDVQNCRLLWASLEINKENSSSDWNW